MNLLDVFDGLAAGVWIVVIAAQILLLAVMVVASVLDIRGRRAGPHR
jgi:UDP-N-acetylmuramyl pentapeptide phosphotransferase/UDP-N-acetylglucosamine-1-phosphate transferase